MKLNLFIILIILYSSNLLFADKIYLKNSKIITGEVIRTTVGNIEYREENGASISSIPINEVLQIEFDNKKTPLEQAEKKDKQSTEKETNRNYKRRYLDSYLKVFLFGGMSGVDGNITDKEHKIFKENEDIFESDDESYDMSHYSFPRGFEINFLSPLLTNKRQSFGFAGLDLGLKTRYSFTTLNQLAGAEFNYYTGQLLKYYTISAGPELNFVFSRESGPVDFIFQIYSLAGYIPYGKLAAAPIVREVYSNNGETGIPGSETKTHFTGYSITGGIGLYWSLAGEVPLIFGFNLFYSHTEVKFKKAIPIYKGSKRSSFNEQGLLIFAGTCFWSVN